MKAPIDREVKLAYVQQILTGKISASAVAKEFKRTAVYLPFIFSKELTSIKSLKNIELDKP